jgi:hypothetical protein
MNVTVFGECNGQPLDNPRDVGWDKTFQLISE